MCKYWCCVPLHCSARFLKKPRPVKTLFLYFYYYMTSTRFPKWHLRHFWSVIFLPLQWNYLRWLRQRRHFIWWWSTPVAVSERDFPHACFTHARCGFTHAVNKSRISPLDHFTNVGVGFRFKRGGSGWSEHDCCLCMTTCLCPLCLLDFPFLQSCLLSTPKVLQEFVLKSHRD